MRFWSSLASLALAACEREDRDFRPTRPAETEEKICARHRSQPGAGRPPARRQGKRYEENAYSHQPGQEALHWFNCNGCHANGGGGSGPALMDDRWIYGSRSRTSSQTIREGRPNGMPSFRGKIPDEQIWQIAAYVRSMSGNAAEGTRAPGRNDDLQAGIRREPPAARAARDGRRLPSAQQPQ